MANLVEFMRENEGKQVYAGAWSECVKCGHKLFGPNAYYPLCPQCLASFLGLSFPSKPSRIPEHHRYDDRKKEPETNVFEFK